MRRLRRTKIVATLGPASGNPATIARLFEAGADVFRINMSHTTHDRMRELVGAIRDVESDRNRPIGILVDLQGPKLRVGSFADGAVMLGQRRDLHVRPRSEARATPHACTCRIRKSSTASSLGTRCCSTTAKSGCRHRGEQAAHRGAGRGRRQAFRPQGRQPARHRDPVLRAHAQGPLRSRCRARRRHRLDRIVVRPAPRRHRRSQEDRARPRRRDGQDREAAGGQPARRDHRRRRRADGGARRSRRGNAAGEGAGHPEADHPRRPPRRQAGGGGNADARKHDLEPGADPRGGVRRRHRDLRRRRRRHAVGGIGRGAISGRGGGDHEPHRRRGRERRHLPHAS